MLVRKTAKTVLSKEERKKERSMHDITESAVSQCVIIFDRISHTSVVYSKINFVLAILVNSIPAANIVTTASYLPN